MGKPKLTLARKELAQRKPTKLKVVKPALKKTFRYRPTFSLQDTILLVGEGNFSFSLALAEMIHGGFEMHCTTFDSEEIMLQKYPQSQEITSSLLEIGATVHYKVDGTELTKHLKKKRFSKIIFNFPHVGKGIKDMHRNILANQELIRGFLVSASEHLTSTERGDECNGEIYLSVKTGEPYDSWMLKSLYASAGLVCKRSFEFVPADYPGYEHRRTLGFDERYSATGNEEITKNPPKMFILIRK